MLGLGYTLESNIGWNHAHNYMTSSSSGLLIECLKDNTIHAVKFKDALKTGNKVQKQIL